MAMHETEHSLKLYLIIAGTLGLLVNLGHAVNPDIRSIVKVMYLITAMFGGAYAFIGANFAAMLANRKIFVKRVFLTNLVYMAILVAAGVIFGDVSLVASSLFSSLIVWYLSINFTRLAANL